MFEKWDLIKVAIGHRTGVVEVKEPSVIIAVSSAHRVASLEVSPSLPLAHEIHFNELSVNELMSRPEVFSRFPKFRHYSSTMDVNNTISWCGETKRNELKAEIPIWKKEFFADGQMWKENPESQRLLLRTNRKQGCRLTSLDFSPLALSVSTAAVVAVVGLSLFTRWRSA
eukprot:1175817-Prorocentrum_minimum.AAC.3